MAAMKIGDLGRQFGVSVETIRYYEREGLLTEPLRTVGNYRMYSARDVERLGFILNCRALDMTLDEIRALLEFQDAPSRDCGHVSVLLDGHIGHVSERIAEMRRLERQLRLLRGACRHIQTTGDCGILRTLRQSDSTKRRIGQDYTHSRSRST